MLQERGQQICAEEDVPGQPPAWKEVHALMRCSGYRSQTLARCCILNQKKYLPLQ